MNELFMSDIINIVLCVMSFLLAAISVVTVIVTIRQNNRMIESSTRPVISVYTESVIIEKPVHYLVVKNFGNSTAYMEKFDCDFDFTGCCLVNNSKNYIKEFSKCNFAPGQSRICILDLNKIKNPVHFSIKYRSDANTYTDEFDIDLSAASGLPIVMSDKSEGKALSVISQTVQEILLKNL